MWSADFVNEKIEQILPLVRKPARYIGNELNSVHKEWDSVSLRIALAYPDLYEVGMSNYGIQILYNILNSQKDVLAERVFCPALDFSEQLTTNSLPLFSLESTRPIGDFDLLGFSIGHELTYTNILLMLKLSGIPFYSKDRNDTHPLIFAGGPSCFNPEPLADFIDFFVIGEAEEIILEIAERVKGQGVRDKKKTFGELVKIDGIYVPALKNKVKRRIVKDFSNAPVPLKPIVSFIETIQDRAVVEIMRGCKRGCKFCNARVIYGPPRERDAERILTLSEEIIKNTGYDKLALISLSSSDYSKIESVSKTIANNLSEKKISLNLPSLRTDSFGVNLAKEIMKVRPSSVTLAPETGSEKLRFEINKRMTDQEIYDGIKAAFQAGINSVKLYFMIGLPDETDEDIYQICEMCRKAYQIGREFTRRAHIAAAISTFVPKPHTAYEREAQIGINETLRRQRIIKDNLRERGIEVRWHQAEASFLEGIFTRGGRELGPVVVKAWELGARLDAWSEFFKFELWQKAFAECGIDSELYLRKKDGSEELPWAFIEI